MNSKISIICLALILCLLESFPAFAQRQSPELRDKFFPDPAVEMNTPGFKKTLGFMTSNEMMSFLEEQVKKRDDIVKVRFAGESMSGKKIPVVYVGKDDNSSKVRIWMQGGLHGNEPAGSESLLMFIDELVASKNIDSILNFVSFAFAPMANIDGYEKQVRDNDNEADLNRDQVTLEQQESVYLKQAFTGFSPMVAIDFHEFRPFKKEMDHFSADKLCIAQDVLFLPSGNLNIPVQLRDITNGLFLDNIKTALSKNNIAFAGYFVPGSRSSGVNVLRIGGDSPRSSSTSYGLTNSVSILIEIRGIGQGRDSYKRRVYSGFLIANSILETTLKYRARVNKAVETSVRATIKRTNPIVLHVVPRIYQGSMNFIDTKTLKLATLSIEMEDAGRSKAVSIRKRPQAYLLLVQDAAIARKLQILGLQIDTLKRDMSFNTEVFTGESKVINEGTKVVSAFSISLQKRIFPKGSFLISTAQKNANVLVSALEPEMGNGYYKYKMIKAKPDGEIPIYRCMGGVK